MNPSLSLSNGPNSSSRHAINSTGGLNPSVLPTMGGRGADPDLFQANCSNCLNLASIERICFHWHICSEWWTYNNTNVYIYFYNILYTSYNFNFRSYLRSLSQKLASAIFDFPKNYLRKLVDFFTSPNTYYAKPDISLTRFIPFIIHVRIPWIFYRKRRFNYYHEVDQPHDESNLTSEYSISTKWLETLISFSNRGIKYLDVSTRMEDSLSRGRKAALCHACLNYVV